MTRDLLWLAAAFVAALLVMLTFAAYVNLLTVLFPVTL